MNRISTEKCDGMGKPKALMAFALAGMLATTATASVRDIEDAWDQEYTRLQGEIDNARSGGVLAKKGAVPSNVKVLNPHALIWDSDRSAVDVILRRTRALLQDIKGREGAPDLSLFELRLRDLERRQSAHVLRKAGAEEKPLFKDAAALRRQIALANPVINFDEMLFITRGINDGNIMCGHQGHRSWSPGAGIWKVSGILSDNPVAQPFLENAVFTNGQWQGRRLGEFMGDNNGGAFCSFDVSFDAQKVVFGWKGEPFYLDGSFLAADRGWQDMDIMYNDQQCFHLYTVNIDGTGLTQLSSGDRNQAFPCWMPGGRIAYVSDEIFSVVRCNPNAYLHNSAALYSMKSDGSDAYRISYHETDELHPYPTNDGKLVFTRWDYIDRSFDAAHHLWISGPDGTDSRAPHGNYPLPHSTMGQSQNTPYSEVRPLRPEAEHYIRPIPNTSSKYIAVEGSHHQAFPTIWTPVLGHGSLIIIDVSVEDDNMMSQVTRLHPNSCFGLEVCGRNPPCDGRRRYICPWPLDENYFIAATPGSIVLLDAFGNEERLLRFSDYDNRSSIMFPRPIAARPSPPVIPMKTFQGERYNHPDHKRAVISVMNVYNSDFDWPPNTKITHLRIVQVIPKPGTWKDLDIPRIDYGTGTNARMVLGTVPVEEDGSAYFEAPVGKEIYFQALDSLGMAVVSMRSGTYVHPGEHLTCVGCHENKWEAVPVTPNPLALQRPPSPLSPGPEGSMPLSFERLARPVLDNNCIPCHRQQGGFTTSDYGSLRERAFYFHGSGQCAEMAEADHGGSRSEAGRFGAHYSLMGRALLDDTHMQALRDNTITREDFDRIVTWLDLNSARYGAFRDADAQDYRRRA
jgi:hypothetical protein